MTEPPIESATADSESAALRGQLRAMAAVRAELMNRLDAVNRAAYIAEREYAESLQEKSRAVVETTAAVAEMDRRLRLLLTSRLLRLGWRIGLGSTPYWADPDRDELKTLLEQARRSPSNAGTANPASDMEAAIEHLVEKGFRPNFVLDIGSAKGYWSVMAAARWPAAEFHMIDPLPQSEPDLKKLTADPRFHYLLLAVGDAAGDAAISSPDDPDSSSFLGDTGERRIVPVETIDRLIDQRRLPPPQMVKLDVQGFELKVLAGGSKLFDTVEVFVIEANLFEFMPGCPTLAELIGFMSGKGYRPFDFAGFLRRPHENDLGQVDVVFVREDSRLVASNRWAAATAACSPFAPPIFDPNDRRTQAAVVICTRNPRADVLRRTLQSVVGQTLPRDQFELIVIDNGSSPAVDVESVLPGTGARVVVEPAPGLSNARRTGIAAASADLLVFVDDDNFLAPDYLERAVAIAESEGRIGLFGGIAVAELEAPIPRWKSTVLPYLGVRDHGPEPITRFADHWGEWEPIGAGMVARRDVAEKFVAMFRESTDARRLGRAGTSLLSGEDSLFARAAHRLGYACSYQPSLKLTHFIGRSRTSIKYLTKLLEGHGRSYVLLNRAIGRPTDPLKTRTAIARLGHRLRTGGRAGLITWFWDLGYAAEKNSESS